MVDMKEIQFIDRFTAEYGKKTMAELMDGWTPQPIRADNAMVKKAANLLSKAMDPAHGGGQENVDRFRSMKLAALYLAAAGKKYHWCERMFDGTMREFDNWTGWKNDPAAVHDFAVVFTAAHVSVLVAAIKPNAEMAVSAMFDGDPRTRGGNAQN